MRVKVKENTGSALVQAIKEAQKAEVNAGILVGDSFLRLQDGETGYFHTVKVTGIARASEALEAGFVCGNDMETSVFKKFEIVEIDMMEVVQMTSIHMLN